ncbi:hypothetical protein Tco_1003961 [Tanacetum coccineum]|uniref:Uncharacterized protein n=1 Tax=Tanacetum coccineum TaxID=301880 RepID=A0ABQ5FBV7_9ASTR
MAQLKYCDKHNQVGFLRKLDESAGFAEIVDFLRGSNLRYALTSNPTIYDSLVKLFWQTATINTKADGTLEINATIDTIGYTITEASIRDTLQLADATGITNQADSLETDLKQTKLTMGNALVKLVKKVKKLEGFLKRRNMVLSDSEEEEPEAQGRKSQDDPLDYLVQGLVTPSTTKVNALGEEQMEDISPNTLEAAKTLSRVASLKLKSIDKGRRYKRRKETKGKKVVSSLVFQEEVDTGAKEVNTAEGVNTGSIKLSTVSEQVSTGSEQVSTHTFEEPSPVHQHFSPPQEQAQGQMAMDDLLHSESEEVGRAFEKERHVVVSDSEEEEPEAQGRKSQDDPLDSSVQGLVTPSTTKVNALGEEQVEDITKVIDKEGDTREEKEARPRRPKRRLDSLQKQEEAKNKYTWITLCSKNLQRRRVKCSNKRKEKLKVVKKRCSERELQGEILERKWLILSIKGRIILQKENKGTWKLSQLKNLSFEEVKEEFDKLVKQVESFAPINFEATKASLKRFGEELQTKTPKRLKDDEAKDDEPTKKSGKRRKQMARRGLHTNIDKDDSEGSDEVSEQDDSVTDQQCFGRNLSSLVKIELGEIDWEIGLSNSLILKDMEIARLKSLVQEKETESAEVSHLCDQVYVLTAEKSSLIAEVSVFKSVVSHKETDISLLDSHTTYLKSALDDSQAACNEAMNLISTLSSERDGLAFEVSTSSSIFSWLLTHGVELAMVKCLKSPEYQNILGHALGWAVDFGMQKGLAAGHEHGVTGTPISAVVAYNPETAEANYLDAVRALEEADFPLVHLLKSKKDSGMDEVLDCFLLDGPLADLPEAAHLQPCLEQLSVPILSADNIVSLICPLGTCLVRLALLRLPPALRIWIRMKIWGAWFVCPNLKILVLKFCRDRMWSVTAAYLSPQSSVLGVSECVACLSRRDDNFRVVRSVRWSLPLFHSPKLLLLFQLDHSLGVLHGCDALADTQFSHKSLNGLRTELFFPFVDLISLILDGVHCCSTLRVFLLEDVVGLERSEAPAISVCQVLALWVLSVLPSSSTTSRISFSFMDFSFNSSTSTCLLRCAKLVDAILLRASAFLFSTSCQVYDLIPQVPLVTRRVGSSANSFLHLLEASSALPMAAKELCTALCRGHALNPVVLTSVLETFNFAFEAVFRDAFGSPVISAGFQAKISKFCLSKEHSSLRPFSVNVDPMYLVYCGRLDARSGDHSHFLGMTILHCSVTVPPNGEFLTFPGCDVDGTAADFPYTRSSLLLHLCSGW